MTEPCPPSPARGLAVLPALVLGGLLFLVLPLLFGTCAHLTPSWLNAVLLLHCLLGCLAPGRLSSSTTSLLSRAAASSWVFSAAYLLDWDQAWQRFPVPNLIGFYLGWTVEKLLARPLLALLYPSSRDS